MTSPHHPAAPPAGAPAPPRDESGPAPINLRLLAAFFLVGIALAAIVANALVGMKPGNRLVVVNAAASYLDSVTVDPEPAGANWFLRRHGLVAGQDSAWIRLPPGEGDADVKVWRGGRPVADHAVQFSGNTIFEIRVGEGAQLGRYRRLGR